MNMRALVWLMAATLAPAFAADDMGIKNQEEKSFHRKISKDLELNYLLYLPKGYKEDADKRYPLMLFLHGSGERGTNLARVAVHGPPKLVKNGRDFPFILVSPQCPNGETWSDDALLGLLDEVTKDYRVDEGRIYLTGLSMGGYGTWSLGLKHPERFAAIAPICGGGEILSVLLPKPGNQALLKKLPVWVFHGSKDPVVSLEESERMVNALKKIGNPNVKLTIYPEAGHDSWTEAYNQQELYDWFLEQTREKRSATTKSKKNSTSG
jgi:predicted peptidase